MKNLKLPSLLSPLAAKTLALGTLTVSVMMAAKPAEAAIFTVGGTDYNVTTVAGTYLNLKTQIEATPWWGNQTLAQALATQIGSGLGLPIISTPTSSLGPFFSFSEFTNEGFDYPSTRSLAYDSELGVVRTGFTPDGNFGGLTYAVGSVSNSSPASAVPEPLTILGSITAAGFGVAFKRKKNSTKE